MCCKIVVFLADRRSPCKGEHAPAPMATAVAALLCAAYPDRHPDDKFA
jgi:hypothetical protein